MKVKYTVNDLPDVGNAEWEELRARARWMASKFNLSNREVAREADITHSTAGRILGEEEFSPQQRTRKAVKKWLINARDREPRWQGSFILDIPPEIREDPEYDLLEYFLENFEQMGTFMSTTTEGLNPRERRMVAMAILNGFKRLLIEAGEPIPPKLRELERRFVDEAGS